MKLSEKLDVLAALIAEAGINGFGNHAAALAVEARALEERIEALEGAFCGVDNADLLCEAAAVFFNSGDPQTAAELRVMRDAAGGCRCEWPHRRRQKGRSDG